MKQLSIARNCVPSAFGRMRWCAVALFLTLTLPAEPTIPATPAGNAFRSWLDAFNSGDRTKVTAYLERYEPEHKEQLDQLLGFRDQTGGFTIVRVEKSEPRHIEALVREREGRNFARLILALSESNPPHVTELHLDVVPRPSDQPAPSRFTFGEALNALEARAADLAGKDKFAGAVLIGRGGKIAIEKSYGLADRETHVSNTTETPFRLGSMNKMFTATAILQLVGEGKIELASPVGHYIPGYPNRDVATKATIRHLLTHTGGTGDIFTPEYQKHRLELRELRDYVKLYGSRGLEFEPGSQWSYSNYGFLLLGVVVERVSGMTYYAYVRKHIFGPAGMRSTDSLPESDTVAGRSIGYMRRNGSWINNADTLPWRGTSAGGGYSTVGDLFLFAQALSSGKLVKRELFAEMTSKQAGGPQMPSGAGYGFGMMVSDEPQGRRFGHGGGAPGMNAEFRVYPRTDTVVVVLSNLDPPAATQLADFFDERMPIN
jgi:CubicO group peptidase (beta-lactamase class C family)